MSHQRKVKGKIAILLIRPNCAGIFLLPIDRFLFLRLFFLPVEDFGVIIIPSQ
jgi:hypothetical protein